MSDANKQRVAQQKQLVCDMANAIDFVLMETIGDHVDSDDLTFISDELKTTVFDVLMGIDEKPGYHVIPNEGDNALEERDLIPGIYSALFDDVNN